MGQALVRAYRRYGELREVEDVPVNPELDSSRRAGALWTGGLLMLHPPRCQRSAPAAK